MSDGGDDASERADAATVTVFSDYVCPFCYLGRQSFAEYRESREEPLRIDWHPFDLRAGQRDADGNVDFDDDDGKDDAYYEQARENVARLREEYDVEMVDDFAGDVDSLPAQLVSYRLAETVDYETWLEFDRAVFDALWTEGRDIGDADVLVDLAADAGAAESTVRAALDDASLRASVEEAFESARRAGVTGVPTFAYDGYAARGAVPPAQLERLVEGV